VKITKTKLREIIREELTESKFKSISSSADKKGYKAIIFTDEGKDSYPILFSAKMMKGAERELIKIAKKYMGKK